MRREREDQLDTSQPSLVVTYGNTTRKVRPLDRELLVLGRASTCDINLVSPEVASIHALIVQVPQGWRVRDCGSRMGTRLNGKAVQESPLQDGDVLQIGSFSFHMNLPGKSAHGTSLRPDRTAPVADTEPPVDEKRLHKLQRSRRHLVELALSLRQRCQGLQEQFAANQQAEGLVEERHAELSRHHEALRAQHRELENKAASLLQLEQELNTRFSVLERELADFEERKEQAQVDAARCPRATNAPPAGAQSLVAPSSQELPQAYCHPSSPPPDVDTRRRLCDLEEREAKLVGQLSAMERERTEIQSTVASLRAEAEQAKARAAAELERRVHELVEREARLAADHAERKRIMDETAAAHGQKHATMVKAQAELREQRIEVIRLMGELRQARQTAKGQFDPAREAVQKENEALRQQLALQQGQLQALTENADREIASAQAALQHLQSEADELAQHLETSMAEAADLARKLDAAQAAAPVVLGPTAAADLQGRVAALQAELQTRDAKIQAMQVELNMFRAGIENSGGYEMELHRFRLEVERDRKLFEEERALLRGQQKEMEDELRQTELQMARERAQMARDRAELQRLREDIQIEREHNDRTGAFHERLAPLSRFRADLTDKNSPNPAQ